MAKRTGVSVPVLRSWEARFGFPAPERLEGGHRRYTEADVAAILEVAAARRAGMSLGAAIERTRAGGGRDRTVYAAIRRRRPELQPLVAPEPTMLALSRAIEDEVLARAEPVALFGSFQSTGNYSRVRERWQELARVATASYVFADFERPGAGSPGPVEVPIDRGDPIAREWSVVADGGRFGAMLAGWELPAAKGARRFECVWSVEPEVVREAATVAAGLAHEAGTEVEVPPALDGPAPPSDPALRDLSRLAHRMVAYVSAA